jgi:DNA polymerase III subunit gamma/tau
MNARARGLFNSGRFADVAGGAVVFAVSSDIMLRKCEEARPDLEAALAAHFGRPVPVRLIVDAAGAGPAPAEPGRGQPPAAPDDDAVDLSELTDAPDAGSGIDRLTQAFPGAEVLEP